jgi:hypothetical protein
MDDVITKLGEAMVAVSRLLAALEASPVTDPRGRSIARTHFETAFLWVAQATDGESIIP